jgi:hypothetical protein
MSHIVSIRTQIRDPAALTAACTRLGLSQPVQGTAQLFAGSVAGLIVQLPGWQFPVVIDTNAGSIAYDNFEGQWGEQKQLDRLLQAYAVEKARIEARRAGHTLTEQARADGSIRLTISMGGGT